MKKAIVFILAATIAAAFFPARTASANSAQRHWRGTYATGAMTSDPDCPVVVERETLTLDIPHFPQNYYESAEQFAEYGARVTAEYVFYNPADYDVSMRMVFPFGLRPDYIAGLDADDTARYDVRGNGDVLPRTLRHSFSDGEFDLSADLPRLADDKRTDGFFAEDTPVTRYDISFEGDGRARYAETTLDYDPAHTRVISEWGGVSVTAGKATLSVWTEGDSFTLYAIGEPIDDRLPAWNFYTGSDKKTAADGRASAKYLSRSTFGETALSARPAGSAVSDTDWYNAVLDKIDARKISDTSCFLGDRSLLDVSDDLMRWYEYELRSPARSRAENIVTAPLYPSIDASYEPPVYKYRYLLSPAASWAEFGALEIRIDASAELIRSSLGKFERKEDGTYYMNLAGLPDGELEFTLSSSKNPKRIVSGFETALYILFGVLAAFALAFAALIILFVVKKKKARR